MMMESRLCHLTSFRKTLLSLYLLFLISRAQVEANERALNNHISAILVFGDSTVDSGNNNYIRTIFKCNFLPYGRDFVNHTPTGRFTNGRLATDFIASYVGVKDYVPPYLDQKLSIEELMTGVGFASGGSGFDPLTARLSNVIPVQDQLEYFKQYKKKLESTIGRERTEDHVNKALFLISAGTNDFILNYYPMPIRRRSYTVQAYEQFLLQHVKEFVQGLWEQGARRIGVVGLPPMGCLPIVMTFNSNSVLTGRGCVQNLSFVASDYNLMLQKELNFMHSALEHSGARILYVDIYGPLENLIEGQGKFGFNEITKGCCGTGYIEASFMCSAKYVCKDASKYVFWDSVHPTETAYYNISNALRPVIDLLIKD